MGSKGASAQANEKLDSSGNSVGKGPKKYSASDADDVIARANKKLTTFDFDNWNDNFSIVKLLILPYNSLLILKKTLYNLSKTSLCIIKISLKFAQNQNILESNFFKIAQIQDILWTFLLSPYNLSLLLQNILYNLSKSSCSLLTTYSLKIFSIISLNNQNNPNSRSPWNEMTFVLV